jgi:hypothetical protein
MIIVKHDYSTNVLIVNIHPFLDYSDLTPKLFNIQLTPHTPEQNPPFRRPVNNIHKFGSGGGHVEEIILCPHSSDINFSNQ